MVAGLTACGSDGGRRVADAATGVAPDTASEVDRFPAEAKVSTCKDYDSVTVGAYQIQSNYWNKGKCPGTQCMDINKKTGAFRVTQGPDPCADTVATYPNVLYGCSFGNCSPSSLLPMPMSALTTATSSWDFSVGGSASDHYDVAYDIWFCPDQSCGGNGFPRGVELMIWLDYKNTKGWQTDLGKVGLSGHTWEVWQAPMGSGTTGWTYLAYLVQGPAVDSVTDFDLGAFFRDMTARGIIQDSWYLYAIQAGNELRTGGIPYVNNSFSVTINGVTPGTSPVVPAAGPSCDGGLPAADGTLNVSNNYVTAGPLHGYAAAWTWVGSESTAIACATPSCSAPDSLKILPIRGNGAAPATAEPVSCAPAFAPSALCTSGTVTGDPSYSQVAGVGFNLNQNQSGGGGTVDASMSLDGDNGGSLDVSISSADGGLVVDGGGTTSALGTVTIPTSITVSLVKSGSLAGNSALRLQLTDMQGNYYCYAGGLRSGVPIPVGALNTHCWDNSGTFATSATQFTRADVIVPGSASSEAPFAFCLTGASVQ
jgi:hypothetical protein